MKPWDPEPRRPGRPRRWENDAEKHRAQRQRDAALRQALGEFVHAVINARHPNRELQQRINAAPDDLAVLEALTAYYRLRHWQAPIQAD